MLVASLKVLASDPIAASVTKAAIDSLRDLFAAGDDAPGSRFAGQAEEFIGDPAQVALAVSILAQDLITSLDAGSAE